MDDLAQLVRLVARSEFYKMPAEVLDQLVRVVDSTNLGAHLDEMDSLGVESWEEYKQAAPDRIGGSSEFVWRLHELQADLVDTTGDDEVDTTAEGTDDEGTESEGGG